MRDVMRTRDSRLRTQDSRLDTEGLWSTVLQAAGYLVLTLVAVSMMFAYLR